MTKKYKLLFLLIIFACGGCANADITRDIRHSGFSLSSEEFICPSLYPSSSATGEFEKIRFLTNTYAITTGGSIYQLSIGQYFSNETNCKKAEFSHRVEAVMDDKVVKADDGKYYYLTSSNGNVAFSEVGSKDSNYYVYKALLSDVNVVKAYTANQEKGNYYVLMRDGNVYNYLVSKDGNNVAISSVSIVYNKSNFNGDIIDFYYAGDSTATFVQTNDAYFRMMITNKDECSTYADIACEYKMQTDEGLTKHKNDILAFSGSFLITTYGKGFTISS